jgi:MFS transporter, DHA1 family, multidrug resistance protein
VKFLRDLFERWWLPGADASGPPLGLLMGIFFTYVGIGMVWSVLTVYATSLGASAATAGATISAFGASRLLVSIPAGLISDRLGRIRVMLVGLLLVAVASFIALAVHSMTTLIICLILQGFGSACYGTAALSALTDRGTPTTRVRDMADYQTATQIGLSIGPGLGGLSAAVWGYGTPFACQGALALIAFLAVMRMPADKIVKPQREAAIRARGVFALVAGAYALAYAIFFGRVASSWILMPLIGHEQFGMGIGAIGALLTASSIANLAILRVLPWVVRRFGRFSVMIGSVSTILVALAILAFAVSGWMLWPFTILMGIGMGLTSALVTAYTADAAPRGQIGAIMGSMRMMTDLGAITGPILAGFCVDQPWLGVKGGIGLCAAVLIVTSATFLATAKGLRRNSLSSSS